MGPRGKPSTCNDEEEEGMEGEGSGGARASVVPELPVVPGSGTVGHLIPADALKRLSARLADSMRAWQLQVI